MAEYPSRAALTARIVLAYSAMVATVALAGAVTYYLAPPPGALRADVPPIVHDQSRPAPAAPASPPLAVVGTVQVEKAEVQATSLSEPQAPAPQARRPARAEASRARPARPRPARPAPARPLPPKAAPPAPEDLSVEGLY